MDKELKIVIEGERETENVREGYKHIFTLALNEDIDVSKITISHYEEEPFVEYADGFFTIVSASPHRGCGSK
jgi:hypothetical protein